MDAANPFAQTPSTPEPMVAQVCRQLAADPFVKARVSTAELDRLVTAAVRELWDCPIKTFVPILALRSVREQLAGMGAAGTAPPEASPAARGMPGSRRAGDVLPIDGDVLPIDGDVLRRDPSDQLLL